MELVSALLKGFVMRGDMYFALILRMPAALSAARKAAGFAASLLSGMLPGGRICRRHVLAVQALPLQRLQLPVSLSGCPFAPCDGRMHRESGWYVAGSHLREGGVSDGCSAVDLP